MSFQKIGEKINIFVQRVNRISSTLIPSPEVSEGMKNFIFLIFILLCIGLVFGIQKLEYISFSDFVFISIIFIAMYLYLVFKPLIFTKIIFYSLLLLTPISLYLRLQEVNQKESDLAKNIITKIAPEFLKYQYYILFGVYTLFEILLRLLSRYSQRLRAKIQENPFTIRFYFIIILAIVSFLTEIFQ